MAAILCRGRWVNSSRWSEACMHDTWYIVNCVSYQENLEEFEWKYKGWKVICKMMIILFKCQCDIVSEKFENFMKMASRNSCTLKKHSDILYWLSLVALLFDLRFLEHRFNGGIIIEASKLVSHPIADNTSQICFDGKNNEGNFVIFLVNITHMLNLVSSFKIWALSSNPCNIVSNCK